MFQAFLQKSSYVAAALAAMVGSLALSHVAEAANLGGDCCADLEERVAELEATTVRKGNKKVSVALSGWIFKVGSWWDDGHESNLYWGDGDTTLSSHFQISGIAKIASGWSAGYILYVEAPGPSASVGLTENQFNDDAWLWNSINPPSGSTLNTLLSYTWITSDNWGTLNWGLLSPATDNVGLLPDLSGTILEENAVLFVGFGMSVRPSGARNSTDLASDFLWRSVTTCLAGAGAGADCNGYPANAFRYDSPVYRGFSMSTSYGEDDIWDIAIKYAADWGNFKVSAAYGFSSITDEGCRAEPTVVTPQGGCTGVPFLGGGGFPFQGLRREAEIHQLGISAIHIPSGLWVYGYLQHEDNDGTRFVAPASDANETDVWYVKAGIRRPWTPLGATVIWGAGGQYLDQFNGLCLSPAANPTCVAAINTAPFDAKGNATVQLVNITGSTVNRWGAGIAQEIDAAAMHIFFRWQHLNLDLDAKFVGTDVKAKANFDDFDAWQLGGVIFF
jgi:hypothetical protein